MQGGVNQGNSSPSKINESSKGKSASNDTQTEGSRKLTYDQITRFSKGSSSGVIPSRFAKAALTVHKHKKTYMRIASMLS